MDKFVVPIKDVQALFESCTIIEKGTKPGCQLDIAVTLVSIQST